MPENFLQSDKGIALMSALAQAGSSYAGRRAGQKELSKEFTDQEESGKKMYESMLEELRSGKYDVSQGALDTSTAQKTLAEEFVANANRRGAEGRSDVVSAIRSGDSRMSGLVPRSISQINNNIQDAELQGLESKVSADKYISDLEQKGLENQRGYTEDIMQRAGEGAEAGRQGRLSAMLAQQGAPWGAIGDGINTGLATYSALNKPEEKDVGGSPKSSQDMNSILDLLGGYGGNKKYENGGLVTEGEFSHEDNPKAIVDEETGVKEGEVTGDELIFNPEQSGEIEALVESNDGKGLLNYFKELLQLPQFTK